jgi:nicotinate-nucleotide pyrophosphorylase (carboxylating)
VKIARLNHQVPIEVEVENLDEFQQALAVEPDRVMLDNFSIPDILSAVKQNQGRIELEASGNINLENIRSIAATGIDFISIGDLTKNLTAVDLSMRIELAL